MDENIVNDQEFCDVFIEKSHKKKTMFHNYVDNLILAVTSSKLNLRIINIIQYER